MFFYTTVNPDLFDDDELQMLHASHTLPKEEALRSMRPKILWMIEYFPGTIKERMTFILVQPLGSMLREVLHEYTGIKLLHH